MDSPGFELTGRTLLSPIERVSAVSGVAARLLDYVTSGQIPGGSRLPPERQLSTIFGVGRSAVREALAALELMGLVVVRPGSGSYLSSADSELVPRNLSWGLMLGEKHTRELIDVRAGLEVQAAELAATRISDVQLAQVNSHLRVMEENTNDLAAFVEADSAFHREIAKASENLLLENLLRKSRSLLRVWVDRALSDQEHAGVAVCEHREVYEAIALRDPAAAGNAMRAHMVTASARLLADFQSAPPRVMGA